MASLEKKRLVDVVQAATLLIAFLLLVRVSCIAAEPADSSDSRWWKGNTHTHSLWSDGDDFPEMIADWYRNRGYHFLALSDHNVLSEGDRWMEHEKIVNRGGKEVLKKYVRRFGDQWVETRGKPGTPGYEVRLKPLNEFRALVEKPGRFLMIQGEEISDRAKGVPVHLNANNIEELIAPQGGSTVAEVIENNLRAAEEQARRTGQEIFVHLNHPNWGLAVTAEDLATVLRERYFEVYNGHPGVKHLGDKHHPSVERMWDIANTIRLGQLKAPPLFGVASDDSHKYHGHEGSRPGRGWIMVRSAKLEADSLIRAIKAGEFYASSGVTLREVQYDAQTKTLRIQIEGADAAHFTTEFIGTTIGYDPTVKEPSDDEGKPLRATRHYSSDVGRVLATVEGASPSYQLTGEELYVRAVVTSDKPHHDPSFKAQRQQAWTQPVGWSEWLERSAERTSAGGE